MSITQEQIKKIKKNLTKLPDSWDKIEQDLASLLWYIDILNELNTDWVKPTISITPTRPIDDYKEKDVVNLENQSDLLKCSKNKIIAWQIAIWGILK